MFQYYKLYNTINKLKLFTYIYYLCRKNVTEVIVMTEIDKMIEIDLFVDRFKKDINDVRLLTKFLNKDTGSNDLMKECIEIINKKVKAIEKATTLEEKKKHVKYKKIKKYMEEHGGE